MTPLLPIIFALVAALYAMAGFGGGSTYIALLIASGLPLAAVPMLALTCNLVVSTQGSLQLIGKGHADWPLTVPLLAGSIPCAFLGGAWRIPESIFLPVLASALLAAGLLMFWTTPIHQTGKPSPNGLLLVTIGATLGLLAGVTGIGGGIYLAPVLHLLGWGRPHAIASCTSLFIALNSLAGLLGQATKGESWQTVPEWLWAALPLAVLVGGFCGSRILASKLRPQPVRRITALVILLVSVRLWWNVVT